MKGDEKQIHSTILIFYRNISIEIVQNIETEISFNSTENCKFS